MTRLIISSEAHQDLQDIGDYIAHNNPIAAFSLITRLKERCLQIAQHPGIGRKRDNLLAGLKTLAEGNFTIFFQHNTTTNIVEIVRIVHGYRDFEQIFNL